MCLEYLNLDIEKVSIHVAFVSVLSVLQMTAFLQDLLINGNDKRKGCLGVSFSLR